MSNHLLDSLAAQYRAQLIHRDAQDAQTLTDAHAHMAAQVTPSLAQLYAAIDAEQKALRSAQDDEDSGSASIPLAWLFAQHRLTRIKETVAHAVNWFTTRASMVVDQARNWVASLGHQAAMAFMDAARVPTPSSAHMDRSVSIRLFTGLAGELAQKVGDALQLGLSLGQDLSAVQDRIAQILDEPRWRALTIAKTQLFQHFNDILLLNYRSNAQTIIGWTWQCRLSSRSCAACIALHGTIHGLDEVLQDHPNGQCFATPYVAGMDVRSGVEWFAQQDEATQRDILGTTVAYDLYAAGNATLHDFVGVRHDHGYAPSVYQRSAKEITRRT